MVALMLRVTHTFAGWSLGFFGARRFIGAALLVLHIAGQCLLQRYGSVWLRIGGLSLRHGCFPSRHRACSPGADLLTYLVYSSDLFVACAR